MRQYNGIAENVSRILNVLEALSLTRKYHKMASLVCCLLILAATSLPYLTQGKRFHGRCADGVPLTALAPTYSIQDCVSECVYRSVCRSINYYRRYNGCFLYTTSTNDTYPLRVCIGTIYQDVRNGSGLLIDHPGVCEIGTCGNETRCQSNSTTSSCEMKECPFTSRLENGYTIGNMNGIYAKRLLYCYSGYSAVGNAAITCEPDGSWSTNGMCESFCGPAPIDWTNNFLNATYAELYYNGQTTVLAGANITMLTFIFLAVPSTSFVELQCHGIPHGTLVCTDGEWSTVPTCGQMSLASPLAVQCVHDPECTNTSAAECRDSVCKCKTKHSYNIEANQCVYYCDRYANTFQVEFGMKLAYNDIQIIYTNSLAECHIACLQHALTCRSFEFNGSQCNLHDITANDGTFGTSSSYDYYQRDCEN